MLFKELPGVTRLVCVGSLPSLTDLAQLMARLRGDGKVILVLDKQLLDDMECGRKAKSKSTMDIAAVQALVERKVQQQQQQQQSGGTDTDNGRLSDAELLWSALSSQGRLLLARSQWEEHRQQKKALSSSSSSSSS